MIVEVPVSVGELVDKITILKIKKDKIKDKRSLDHVKRELDLLLSRKTFECSTDLEQQLFLVNLELWEIEDRIRAKERKGEFDQEFIDLARAVYQTNDRRAQIKKKINEQCNSALFEVKSYEHY